MNSLRTVFFALATTLTLAGCPDSTTPADSSSHDDATGIDATTSANVEHACMLYGDYYQRCGQTDCLLTQFVAHCPSIITHYRPELVSYLEECLPQVTCNADGGTGLTGPCSTASFNMSFSPSAAQRSAIDALCASCPSIAGSMVTSASACSDALLAAPGTDGGTSNGVGIFLRYLDDATATQVQTDCVAAAQMDGGLGCSGQVLFCMLAEIGYAPVFNACNDAGTSNDAGAGD